MGISASRCSIILEIDTGGDRFQFADPFLEVCQLDPAGGGGKPVIAGLGGKLKPLEVEPGLPSLEAGNCGQGGGEENAGAGGSTSS